MNHVHGLLLVDFELGIAIQFCNFKNCLRNFLHVNYNITFLNRIKKENIYIGREFLSCILFYGNLITGVPCLSIVCISLKSYHRAKIMGS